MKSADQQRRDDLARIHILKAAIGLDRDTYEDVLWTHGKQHSSANLDSYGRGQVIKQLDYLLRKRDPAHKALQRSATKPRNFSVKDRAELTKIEALLTDAGRDWTYAKAMAKHMYKREALEFCHAGQLAGIVAALEKDALKRLSKALEGVFGESWLGETEYYAKALFSFDAGRRSVDRYSQPMSQVLRWWRGEIVAACAWPIDAEARGDLHCAGCSKRWLAARG